MSTIIYCTKHEKYDGKYIVIDWYEALCSMEADVIGRGLERAAAEVIRDKQIEDTDGECDVEIYRMVYNPSNSGRLMEVVSE